jgi:GMP reductase
MPCCQNDTVLDIFAELRWPYVYHRLGGTEDIFNFVKKANMDDWYLISISVGVSNKDKELLGKIKIHGLRLDWITIDVALIYNIYFEDFIKWVRKEFPSVYLIAGNFSNDTCVGWLENLGVDCLKFGIGCSKLCRTKQYTGFGSSIDDFIDCCQVAKSDIMFDGGLTILNEEFGEIAYGDIFKVIALGATWVMSSSLFRWSHELSDHGIVNQYGNSTARAKGYNKNIEGAVKSFKSQYNIEDQMRTIKENLQSSVSYSGYENLTECKGYLMDQMLSTTLS